MEGENKGRENNRERGLTRRKGLRGKGKVGGASQIKFTSTPLHTTSTFQLCTDKLELAIVY